MESLKEIQKEIINNRIIRGWQSATDLSKTTLGLVEEVGEFEKARRIGNIDQEVDALVDIIIFALGGLEILDRDALPEITRVIQLNSMRTHAGTH